MSRRLSLQLDDEAAEELCRQAAAAGADPEEYAAILITALLPAVRLTRDEATELLRGMPGALDDARQGSDHARQGLTTPLDAL